MLSNRRERPIAVLAVAAALGLPALAMLLESPALSQKGGKATPSVQSIETPAPALGKVVSAPTGNTVFRAASSSGDVTKVSGNGYRVSSGNTRSLVTLTCTGMACENADADITISSIGSPTGRALPLTNFTVTPVTAVINNGPNGTNPLTFRIRPIGNGGTKSFYVGADFTIAGDESGSPTGEASAAFQVLVEFANPPTSGSGTGLATATVFRPITIALTSNLGFGAVSRPFAGSGTVNLDAATGTLSLTGQGVQLLPVIAAPARAGYTVNGEGGQVFSIYIPSTFQMAGPTSNLTVTTSNTSGGIQNLSGTLGSPGSYSFHVGGSFPITATTPVGVYSGTYGVLVQYN